MLTVDGHVVGSLLDLDVQPSVGKRVCGAGDAAVEALQCDGTRSAGQAHAVGDLGDGADAGVFLLVVGNEEDAVLLTGVDGKRERHTGEDDDVVQRD